MSRFYNLEQAPFNGRELSNRIVATIAGQYNGAFFDAQDLSTMFQDAAGTTPVTAMEQPVGMWLDKSGNGNHATQSVTASRPVVSARYNVLLGTDSPVTQSITASGVPATLSFYGTGSVQLSGAYSGVLNGTGVNNRVSLSFNPSASSLTLTIFGSVTNIMLHRGSSLLPYQRVTTATNYNTVGFKKYLKFDGVDDYLKLPYMGLYANGSASAIIAMSQGGPDAVYERILSETNTNTANQRYLILRGELNGGGVDSLITDNANTMIIDTALLSNPLNTPSVISFVDSGTSILLNRNADVSIKSNYARSGTVTLNSTMLGAQQISSGINGFSLMSVYGLIITKSALSDSERRRAERLLAYNSGAQI